MEVVVDHADAQRGCLIMNEQGRLIISAEIDLGNGKEFRLPSAPIEESQRLAEAIVHHVNRTGECIVLGNAANEGAFTHDSYVVANQPRSVLCMPIIRQGKIFALLYLENRTAANAFTRSQLQTLSLLATQIGVSLEHARLYQNIERTVEERTEELKEKSELLTIAREVLEQAYHEMAREIEQRKQLEQELRKLATTDYLTGLFTRRQLFEQGEKEISRAQRSGAPLSLMILDIDHFKSINDTYGHAVGDEVLKNFSALLRDSLRNVDLICRFGGEEFVAILPETDAQTALDVAQRLRHNTEACKCSVAGIELRHTISIGLTSLRGKDTQISQLIHRADEALYRAKSTGRNRLVVAPETRGPLSR